MTHHSLISRLLAGASCAACLVGSAWAASFDIPRGDLASALDAYSAQSGVPIVVSASAAKSVQTSGVRGDFSAPDALSRILKGTGLTANPSPSGVVEIIGGRGQSSSLDIVPMQLAQATPPRAAVETVTVTSSKLGGADVQSIPISITALSQEQLTATQTAGGPDLIKQVPNMTFTKTNFSGYSIQLRGIGTQAISVTTDPAVAVAFNDIPFIRNHFFEQEFFDVAQVEVLRGPQGTLYGRNATAGVVNLTSAKPTDQFEAMASAEIGNYQQRRFEGMINLPIVDDRLGIRVAGEWTKRQGYSFNETTDSRIDGRDLWSGRVTIGFKPSSKLQTYLVWEHFSEGDDRLRSGKQLCTTDQPPTEVDGRPVGTGGGYSASDVYLSQGCKMGPLYGPEAFQVPYGRSLPYYSALLNLGPLVPNNVDPYAATTQSQNYRVIQSQLTPSYKAKNNTLEFNADYQVTPALTFTSQTGFNNDFMWSTEDYNRFNTTSDIFLQPSKIPSAVTPDGNYRCVDGTLSIGGNNCINFASNASPTGAFCDPQLGCSSRLMAEDLVEEHSWQLSQEFRLASHFSGPFNFSVGGNYMHYETEENYYVFINALTLLGVWTGATSGDVYTPGVSDNSSCAPLGRYPTLNATTTFTYQCPYIDPNPISSLNNQGHNYFLSQNPYVLNSYAVFGEAYYDISENLKLTTGLRFTEDQKHFSLIPSWVTAGFSSGYPVTGVVDQQWDQFSGRAALNWSPKLNFTDQTLIYGSYAHGYKAGGANPPGAILLTFVAGNGETTDPVHPLTFKPEFVDAFELGTKNTLLDGALTLNGNLFYYNYQNYQISQIVDRTAVNLNFDAHIKGAEVEATWEPIPGLRFNFAGGYEDTSLAQGSRAVDLMDRTAGNSDWLVVKPFLTQASNCILPAYVVAISSSISLDCGRAYGNHNDPLTNLPYVLNPTVGLGTNPVNVPYSGFNPLSVDPNAPADVNNGLGLPPNNGEGFYKDLSGHKLPNAPPFTVSAGAQYTVPLTPDWAGTLRADYYWQDNSWARIYNDDPYDRLHGYSTVNLTLILTSQSGWQVMLYDKNLFNQTAITGTFLNSDDSGLTTNVFLTDPKLIGLRVTKNW